MLMLRALHSGKVALLALAVSSSTLPLMAQETTSALPLPDGVTRVSPSELKIHRDHIVSPIIRAPIPQGIVDRNPPWLHVRVPLTDEQDTTNQARKKKVATEKWHRRFYFRLSRDPEFKQNVIESGPKRWSFFNPYRQLEKGTWYWTYGLAAADTPDQPQWSGKTYSFVISGDEFTSQIPPTPEVLVDAIKRRKSGPVTICDPEEIGHLLPTTTWPELADQIRKDCRKALSTGERPAAVHIDDKEFPSYMEKPTPVYFVSSMRQQFTVEQRRVVSLLRAYLLTGDPKGKELGLKRAIELENLRRTARWNILGKEDTLAAHATYGPLPYILVDAFYDDLPAEHRQMFSDLVFATMCDKGSTSPDMHDQLEHVLYDNHAWQGKVNDLLMGSIILCRHRPELEDWVKYAYELFLYRSPAFSRNDGGSSEGNGYLGVHEEPLTHIPWTLYKLTGHNFYRDKPWYGNFSRYMAISNPKGSPGISFEDSGSDEGTEMPYLTEILAHMCPEIPENLWRYQTTGRRNLSHFSADLNKGNKAWDLLAVWKRFPSPDLSKVQPPTPPAAAFGDIGLVCMETDVTSAARNLMVNFRAGPYGSESHTHPAQNAFTLAFGGEPLFWRTGYYNGGSEHNIHSYKSSRAHNTILADGLVQGFDQGAYAWIARFAHGERISYTLGDASAAYNGKHHYFTIPYQPDGTFTNKVDERRNSPIATQENGFGNPGVTRFRRHIALLRPHHVVIYDELEAKRPITWTFQLGTRQEMTQISDACFKTANSHALGSARLFCSSAVKATLTNRFMGEPKDEENKRNGQNPPNWHALISTREPLPATRFLTILQVEPGKGLTDVPADTVSSGTGRIRITAGDYTITAELDARKPSYLEVHDRNDTCALVTGQGANNISLTGKQRAAKNAGSTLLWEKGTKGEVFLEKGDELPDCLRFGNPY